MENNANMIKATSRKNSLRGFKTLFKRENKTWWKTLRWLGHLILWVVVINGVMAFVLFALVPLAQQMGEADAANFDPVSGAAAVLYQIGTIGFTVGTIVITQDCIFSERENGITEWLLSKPVSRKSYVLSKLVSNGIGIFVTLLLMPALIGYLMISIATKTVYSHTAFWLAFLGLVIHTFFYLSLTIYLGVVAHQRNIILGISLGILFVGMFAVFILGPIVSFLPWVMPNLLPAIASNQEIPFSFLQSYIFTTALTLLLIYFSLKRIEKLEF